MAFGQSPSGTKPLPPRPYPLNFGSQGKSRNQSPEEPTDVCSRTEPDPKTLRRGQSPKPFRAKRLSPNLVPLPHWAPDTGTVTLRFRGSLSPLSRRRYRFGPSTWSPTTEPHGTNSTSPPTSKAQPLRSPKPERPGSSRSTTSLKPAWPSSSLSMPSAVSQLLH